jgi:hypothetical protein
MQTLPIIFNQENIPKAISDFIEISVNFWNKVLPPLQNAEIKFSPEIFSERADYYSHIINQHEINDEQFQNQSNSHIVPEKTQNSQETQNFNGSIQNSHQKQNSNETNQESQEDQNFDSNVHIPNYLHESIISLISECYQVVYPGITEFSNFPLIDKLTLIKTSLIESSPPPQPQPSFRSYYLDILKNFDSSLPFQEYDNLKLLKSILAYSKSTLNNVHNLSLFLIEIHPKTSISNELQQLLTIFQNTIPAKKKQYEKYLKVNYFRQNSSMPLIQSYFHFIEDFPQIYLHFTSLIHSIDESCDYKHLSMGELIQSLLEIHKEFGLSLRKAVTTIAGQISRQLDWTQLIHLINEELNYIQKLAFHDSDLNQLPINQMFQKLIQFWLNAKKKDPANNQLFSTSVQIIQKMNPTDIQQQTSNLSLSTLLQNSFIELNKYLNSIKYSFDLDSHSALTPKETYNQTLIFIEEIRNQMVKFIALFSPLNSSLELKDIPLKALFYIFNVQIDNFSSNFYSFSNEIEYFVLSYSIFDDLLRVQAQMHSICQQYISPTNQNQSIIQMISERDEEMKYYSNKFQHPFDNFYSFIKFFEYFAEIQSDIEAIKKIANNLFEPNGSFPHQIQSLTKHILDYLNTFDSNRNQKYNQLHLLFGFGIKPSFPMTPIAFASFIDSISNKIIQSHEKSRRHEEEIKSLTAIRENEKIIHSNSLVLLNYQTERRINLVKQLFNN